MRIAEDEKLRRMTKAMRGLELYPKAPTTYI